MDKRLNDLLLDAMGNRIESKEAWLRRADEYRALIEHCMLGHAPNDHRVKGEVISSRKWLDGKAIYEIVQVYYGPRLDHSFMAHIIRPAREGRFPAITWNAFTFTYECPRLEDAIDRGYVIALFDKEQLYRDNRDTLTDPAMRTDAADAYPLLDWRAIRIWAWGHSKLIDYLETQDYVDATRFVATGWSRGGKTALAAGAFDKRIAVAAPINSGCGGAGCLRVLGDRNGENGDPRIEESLGRITNVFPHWFTDSFTAYGNPVYPHEVTDEVTLPFDLHALKAAVAPRAVLSVEGLDDSWANPYGTYLTWQAAQPVFDLMGAPDANNVFYREGGHDFGDVDWKCLLDFCDHHFFGKGEVYWNNGDRYFGK